MSDSLDMDETVPREPWSERFRRGLFAPVDAASLAVFRIMYGLILLWEVYRYFKRGWIHDYYIQPGFHFKYLFFEWVTPLPGNGMYLLFAGLGVAALMVAIGCYYRAAAIACFLGWSYVFLLDQARYLYHMYLLGLVAFIMCFLGANREWSLDRRLFGHGEPATIPAWNIWILRFQMFVVYFYAGLAKINADWLRGEPFRAWLAEASAMPLIGGLLGQSWMVWVFAYGGLLFDLGIGFLLLSRRTQAVAIVLAALFHVTNSIIFRIGIFPWFAMALTLIFLDPDWPRAWQGSDEDEELEEDAEDASAAPAPAEPPPVTPTPAVSPAPVLPRGRKPREALVLWCLGLYAAAQLLIPFRHWLYPGDVNWTEEGHRFSWRMKLRDKDGHVVMTVRDPGSNEEYRVDPADVLERWQLGAMLGRPDMVLQLAHLLRDRHRQDTGVTPKVYADVRCSLNGGPERELIDPEADLAAVERSLKPAAWIRRW